MTLRDYRNSDIIRKLASPILIMINAAAPEGTPPRRIDDGKFSIHSLTRRALEVP